MVDIDKLEINSIIYYSYLIFRIEDKKIKKKLITFRRILIDNTPDDALFKDYPTTTLVIKHGIYYACPRHGFMPMPVQD